MINPNETHSKHTVTKQSYYLLKNLPNEQPLSKTSINTKSYHPEVKDLQLILGNNATPSN